MNKFFITAVLAIACFSIAYGQEENTRLVQGNFYPWDNSQNEPNKLTECYTLVSDANVREKSNATATVVAKLPIATKVTIESVTTDTLDLNGFSAPWCKVSFMNQGKKQSGYLWGGTLAFAAYENKEEYDEENFGTIYLVGMSKFQKDKTQAILQVRVAKKGVEIAKTEFQTVGDVGYMVELEVLGNHNLKNVKDIFRVNSYYPACGYGSGNSIIFYNGKTLNRVLETSDSADGGVFYSSETALLPQDKGGIAGHVVLISDLAEFEEKETANGGFDMILNKQEFKINLYKWDGTKLVKKTKEISNKD